MLLFCKLWGMSWSYRDGAKANEVKIVKGKFDAALSADQLATCLHQLPSVLEFSSFVLFFGGCICGPFFEFSDYKNWIELAGQYRTLPTGLINGFQSLAPALTRVSHAFYCIVINIIVALAGFDSAYPASKEFSEGNFLYNVFYYNIAMTGRRF